MSKFVTRLMKDESGATAIEYGLIVALIAVVIISAVTAHSAALLPDGRSAIIGFESGTVTLERDAAVSGILEGGLVIRSGVNAVVKGIIEGSVVVEPGAVLYLDGIVKGNVDVGGAACIEGIIQGSINPSSDATICLDGHATLYG